MNKKCGIISIVGRSNVGKSTIINNIVGKKISIISNKINTTRNKILGIKTYKDHQVVFVDTPGLYSDNKNLFHLFIKKQIKFSLEISQVILFVIEALKFTKEDEKIFYIIKKMNVPIILVINKIDLLGKNISLLLPFIEQLSSNFKYRSVIPIIAIKKNMVVKIEKEILKEQRKKKLKLY